MRARAVLATIPLWVGCGDGESTSLEAPEPEFSLEETLVEFTQWTRGGCALFADDSVQCWQDGARSARRAPHLRGRSIAGRSDVTSIGGICVALSSGAVECVDDSCGVQIECTPGGDCEEDWDTGPCRFDGRAEAVEGIEPAASLALATDNPGTVVVLADGRVQLQDALPSCAFEEFPELAQSRTSPPIALPSPAIAVDTERQHSCFVTADGHVYCAGEHSLPDFVVPGSGPCVWPPEAVPGIDDAIDVSLQMDSTCILRRSGTVNCFGWAYSLGIRNGDGVYARGDVLGIDDAVAIDSSLTGTCALRRDGTLWCWGAGTNGQFGAIGNDEWGNVAFVEPQPIHGVSGARGLGMMYGSMCVVYGPNDTWCWGGATSAGQIPALHRVVFEGGTP